MLIGADRTYYPIKAVESQVKSRTRQQIRHQCPLCYASVTRREFSKKGWDYWRCGCEHVFVAPLPSEPETRVHYERSYSKTQLVQSRTWFEVLARNRMDLIDEHWGQRTEGVLIDAGSGYGFFLNEARSRGWSVRGIDYSGYPMKYATEAFGLDVVADDIGAALGRLPDTSVDILTFWHVMEHLNNPGQILDCVVDKLAPGGYLILNAPNLDSAAYRLCGRFWNWIYTPGHVQYFSLASLVRGLETRGFEIKRAETWTHAPNLYFLLADSLLNVVCDVLQPSGWKQLRGLGYRLRRFAQSNLHQHVLQLKLFKVLYEWTPILDRFLRQRMRGHELLLVAGRRDSRGSSLKRC